LPSLGTDNTTKDLSSETAEAGHFDLADVPALFNPQHRDVLNDLRTGRTGIYR
jgi:hypothetical protein